MNFSLTTRWNAHRHARGEDMIAEILDLGFHRVELGYDLRQDLVPGVQAMVAQNAVIADTVHCFCPVPMGVPRGHPELWTLGDRDAAVRRNAMEYTKRTIRFAAEIGAKAVVVHCGNVKMTRYTPDLIALAEEGRQFDVRYEKLLSKMQVKRERKAPKQLAFLTAALEALLPVLEEYGIRLGLENLPSWEAIPTEIELFELLRQWNTPWLGYWHDAGHAQVRQNLGLISQDRWLERLSPWLVGMHLHDVAPPAYDHLMPPQGKSDFARLTPYIHRDIYRVLEPGPRESADQIREALAFFQRMWDEVPGAAQTQEGG